MKKIFLFSAMFFGIIAMMPSCKKNNDIGSGGSGSGGTTSLTLSLSKTTIDLNNPESVTATVVNQTNADVTSSCIIKVNGAAITGATFTPTAAGTYSFVAVKDSINSSPVTLNVLANSAGPDSLFVSLSSSTVEYNTFDYVSITVTNKAGIDVTSSSQVLLNGMSISSKYVPDAEGTYTVTASKGSLPSTSKTLTVIPRSASPFTTKLLAEDCTGAWCGYCPRLANKLEIYKNAHPKNCIVVAVHGGSGTDPYKYQYYSSFNTTFGITGYPTVIYNRLGKWSENTADLNAELTKWAPLGLAIESAVSGANVTGKIKVKYNVTTERKMKIVIALVENGLVYPQVNYYSPAYGNTPYLYGGVSPVTNFVHNGVLRRAATDIFGDAIPTAGQIKNGIWEKTFSIPLSGVTSAGTGYTAKSANSTIVAFVIDDSGSNDGVLNAQSAAVGAIQNFD
jgi:thiol-disulfide isomerase/thioredoxin